MRMTAWTPCVALALLGPPSAPAQPEGCCATPPTLVPLAGDRGPAQRVLRISADPNNLPFTNQRLEGFENKIAELLARELNADLEYHWRAQRRGFFRLALKENECDVVL